MSLFYYCFQTSEKSVIVPLVFFIRQLKGAVCVLTILRRLCVSRGRISA